MTICIAGGICIANIKIVGVPFRMPGRVPRCGPMGMVPGIMS